MRPNMLFESIPYSHDLWRRVEPLWRAVYREAGETSLFLTPEWTAGWIEAYGERTRPVAWTWRDDGGGPLACALVSVLDERIGPFRVRRAYLNATGEDEIASEHNDLLVLPSARVAVVRALVAELLCQRVDELALVAFRDRAAEEVRIAWPSGRSDGFRSAAPFVDLTELRDAGGDYLCTLSSNTRSQIRRSVRLYTGRYGRPSLQVAGSAPQALEWLGHLISLHEGRWRQKRLGGAFGNPEVHRFHERLMQRAFLRDADLSVDLCRVSFGEHPIGFLYNLRRNGVVNFYQSGIEYDDDNRLKPGLVAHALAIEHYLEMGAREYDFLADGAVQVRYKQSLADRGRDLHWLELPSPTLRMKSIGWVRDLGRAARALVIRPSR